MDRKDWAIFSLIYLLALGITLKYALFDMTIIADHLHEYSIYLLTIENGNWQNIPGSIVGTCLITTYIPAKLYPWLGIDAELLYRIFPCIFYSLMPPFIYLISRKYLDRKYAILASILPITSFFFIYYPAIGRWGVALGFMAGMFWAILYDKRIWAVAFALLLVLSHYGTTFIAAFTIIPTLLVYLAIRRFNRQTITLGIVTMALILFIAGWQFGLADSAGRVAKRFVQQSLEQLVGEDTYTSITPNSLFPTIEPPPNINNPAVASPAPTTSIESPTKTTTVKPPLKTVKRDPIIAIAFGSTLPYMNMPQKVEFTFSWIIVVSITLGLAYTPWRRILPLPHSIMASALYICILLTMLVPHISFYYGVARVYHTSLIAISPVFVIGLKALSNRIRVPGYIVIGCILLVYGICVSGIMHSFFGITK